MDLEGLYRYLRWPMEPGDPGAVERYEAIMGFFAERLGAGIPLRGEASILDVAAGTGIASVALAEALTRRGVSVREIVVTDVRGGDLARAAEWLEARGLRGVGLSLARVDARRLADEVDGRFDYILLWGSSLPHFSTWDYALVAANTRVLTKEDGVLMIEQRNILPSVLHSNTYKQIYVAPGKSRENLILSILSGYDEFTGMDVKQHYLAPGLRYIGETHSRLWDLATALTITWLFYEEVRLLKPGRPRVEPVITASKPRRDAPTPSQLWRTLPQQAATGESGPRQRN